MKSKLPCSIDGCDKPVIARTWCQNHYKRWELYGSPTGRGTKHGPMGEGCINPEGYRVHTVRGQQVKEHRAVMEEILGRPLRSDEVVHHKDGSKANNDPSNLEVMTNKEHAALHANSRPIKTHCGRGHEWNEENTYIRKNGSRMCRVCLRENSLRRYYAKKHATG